MAIFASNGRINASTKIYQNTNTIKNAQNIYIDNASELGSGQSSNPVPITIPDPCSISSMFQEAGIDLGEVVPNDPTITTTTITNNQTIQGTSEPNNIVKIDISDRQEYVLSDHNGNWSLDLSNIPIINGNYTITASHFNPFTGKILGTAKAGQLLIDRDSSYVLAKSIHNIIP